MASISDLVPERLRCILTVPPVKRELRPKGVHSRGRGDVTRRTRWLTTYHGYFQIVLSQVTCFRVWLLPSKRSCQVYQQHHGTSRKGQFLHASEIPFQYRHVEDLQPLITKPPEFASCSPKSYPATDFGKKMFVGGGYFFDFDDFNPFEKQRSFMWCQSCCCMKTCWWFTLLAVIWLVTGTRHLGESCFCWAPKWLANVADGVTQFEGQMVKKCRFFVDFSLCYWEFSQQKPSGFCWI